MEVDGDNMSGLAVLSDHQRALLACFVDRIIITKVAVTGDLICEEVTECLPKRVSGIALNLAESELGGV